MMILGAMVAVLQASPMGKVSAPDVDAMGKRPTGTMSSPEPLKAAPGFCVRQAIRVAVKVGHAPILSDRDIGASPVCNIVGTQDPAQPFGVLTDGPGKGGQILGAAEPFGRFGMVRVATHASVWRWVALINREAGKLA